MRPEAGRTAIVAGATGLVGSALLRGLIDDASVGTVVSLGRRAPPVQSNKLTALVVDFRALPPLPPADEVYLALGTTIKDAGSQAAFRALDFDANLAVAKAALAAGAKRAGLVSALGVDAKSRVFFNRVKGELEDELRRLPFEGLVIARPSLLVGSRSALGQRARPGEQWGFALNRVIGFLLPANLKPIPASDVAKALLAEVPKAKGVKFMPSGAMRR